MEPCAHCGKSVACVVTAAQMWPDDPEASDSSYAVFCDAQRPRGPGGCGASGGFFPTEAEAIAAWNRRAPAHPVWCGCGDGIMPDTGAKCGTCVAIAEMFQDDRQRPIQLQGEASPQGARLDAEAARSARIHEAQPNGQDESDEHLLRKAAEALTHDDVLTLIGHAEALRIIEGQTEMPAYLLGLAERIARARGDLESASRAAALIGRGK
jgi:hypothetical protein